MFSSCTYFVLSNEKGLEVEQIIVSFFLDGDEEEGDIDGEAFPIRNKMTLISSHSVSFLPVGFLKVSG
jgi:hypothetical protein